MEKIKEQPQPGTNSEFQPEELKAERLRIVEEKKEIIKQLNQIKHPLNATVFTHGQSWTIRNKAFWTQMQKKDDQVIDFLEKYLIENK